MNELRPELRELFRATAEAYRPSMADQERVFSGLASRLGPIALTPPVTPPCGPRHYATRALIGKVAGASVATLALIAATTLSLRTPSHRNAPEIDSAPRDSVVSTLPATSSRAPEPAAVAASQSIVTAEEVVVEPRAKRTAPSPEATRGARPHDRLEEESALLSRAQAELRRGNGSKALQIVAEHERRFNRGILAQERKTIRIQALCSTGRVTEANTLLRGVSPQSLAGQSVRQACASLSRGGRDAL